MQAGWNGPDRVEGASSASFPHANSNCNIIQHMPNSDNIEHTSHLSKVLVDSSDEEIEDSFDITLRTPHSFRSPNYTAPMSSSPISPPHFTGSPPHMQPTSVDHASQPGRTYSIRRFTGADKASIYDTRQRYASFTSNHETLPLPITIPPDHHHPPMAIIALGAHANSSAAPLEDDAHCMLEQPASESRKPGSVVESSAPRAWAPVVIHASASETAGVPGSSECLESRKRGGLSANATVLLRPHDDVQFHGSGSASSGSAAAPLVLNSARLTRKRIAGITHRSEPHILGSNSQPSTRSRNPRSQIGNFMPSTALSRTESKTAELPLSETKRKLAPLKPEARAGIKRSADPHIDDGSRKRPRTTGSSHAVEQNNKSQGTRSSSGNVRVSGRIERFRQTPSSASLPMQDHKMGSISRVPPSSSSRNTRTIGGGKRKEPTPPSAPNGIKSSIRVSRQLSSQGGVGSSAKTS